MLALGGFFGFVLKLLFRKRSTDNRLIVSLATLFAFCGVCALLDVSPLLGCMSMGMVYINLTNDSNLFQQLAYFSPPVLLLFFVRSGLNFRLDALFGTQNTLGSVPLILVGVLYFITRIAGKYAGAWLGCLLVRKPKRTRDYLGSRSFHRLVLPSVLPRSVLGRSGARLGRICRRLSLPRQYSMS